MWLTPPTIWECALSAHRSTVSSTSCAQTLRLSSQVCAFHSRALVSFVTRGAFADSFLSSGIRSFCGRAIQVASSNLATSLAMQGEAQRAAAQPVSTGGSVADLVKVPSRRSRLCLLYSAISFLSGDSKRRSQGPCRHYSESQGASGSSCALCAPRGRLTLQEIHFLNLHNQCLPSSADADRVASAIAKVKKVGDCLVAWWRMLACGA